jgi:UDP-4-amino-4,6-dideoxy-N-acetyl-beta-L-altrosamine transaminase
MAIPYGRQDISQGDIEAVTAALREAYITQGPTVERFETLFAQTVGARFAVVFNSGTAALHAAYHAAGVGPGNTVLTSPITFVATANAARYLGADVRFADVDPVSALLDAERAGAAAQGNVAVLAPVHLAGHVAPMEGLADLARSHGWKVVEDAAHALGARYRTGDAREHRVGACHHSDMCCFSFHPVKHITTGEGGAVTTNDESLARALRRFRSHGITKDVEGNHGPWYYEQHDLGFNYRLTDFQCALGISQLARLDSFVERRRSIAERYDAAFGDNAGVRPLRAPVGSVGSYHLYVVRVAAPARRQVFDALRAAGIGVQVHYIPVYRQPYYRAHGFAEMSLANAEAYYAEAISLPMYPGLSADDVDLVVRTVTQLVARATVRG